MAHRISDAECFERNESDGLLADLVLQCFRDKSSFCLKVVGNRADLELRPIGKSGKCVRVGLQGAPGTLAKLDCDNPGSRLILPLLGNIVRVDIPHNQIFATHRHRRSIADFFARNLALACCRNDGVIFVAEETDEPSPLGAKVSERYLWILRSLIDDPALSANDLTDKLQIDAHFRILNFDSPVLRDGASDIRRRNAGASGPSPQVRQDMKKSFMDTRARMLQHFPT